MTKKTISAKIIAHSKRRETNDELVTMELTFPRHILAEVNTHRMFSRNTSSSRAIPFHKMVEVIENNPFIPMVFQKNHKGMQGTDYIDDYDLIEDLEQKWLMARDNAVKSAQTMHFNYNVTKQMCNRLLEPFMWTTMLVTTTREGLYNFFRLRCPIYTFDKTTVYNSKKEAVADGYGLELKTTIQWLMKNEGQAEIHMMELAEQMYDAYRESVPQELTEGDWHIPYLQEIKDMGNEDNEVSIEEAIKVSASICARISYTNFDHNENDVSNHLDLYKKLVNNKPPHSSPLEHIGRCMTYDEYRLFIKGKAHDLDIENQNYENGVEQTLIHDNSSLGWCNNLKGFIQLRYLIDNGLTFNE